MNDKMQISKLMVLILFLLVYACKQEEIISKNGDQNIEDPSLKYVEFLWKFPLAMDTSERASMTPVLSNGNVVFTAKIVLSPDPARVKCIDTAYRTIVWEANDIFMEACNDISMIDGSGHGVYLNYFATLCDLNPRVVDLTNGDILWDYNGTGGDSHMCVWNDKFFHSTATGINPFTHSELVMSDILTQNFRTIYEVDSVAGYSCHLYPPAVLINDENDTLLFFQNRQWKSPPYDGKIDFYGYNMSDDTLLWKLDDINESGNSAVFIPLIHDNKVYFKAGFEVFCLDAETGNIIWEFDPPSFSDMLLGNLIIAENMLIVKTSGSELYAVSLESGGIIWSNLQAGDTPNSLAYFDGVVYYVADSDSKLHAIEVATGKELWSIISPNRYESVSFGTYFYNGVAIDPATRRLYITDTHFINCFQLK